MFPSSFPPVPVPHFTISRFYQCIQYDNMKFSYEGFSVLRTLERFDWEINENKVLVFSLTHELFSNINMDNLEIG